jgi:hypothetical protein
MSDLDIEGKVNEDGTVGDMLRVAEKMKLKSRRSTQEILDEIDKGDD